MLCAAMCLIYTTPSTLLSSTVAHFPPHPHPSPTYLPTLFFLSISLHLSLSLSSLTFHNPFLLPYSSTFIYPLMPLAILSSLYLAASTVSRGISKAADMGAACREIRDEINACRQTFLSKVKAGKRQSLTPYTLQLLYSIPLSLFTWSGYLFIHYTVMHCIAL